MPAVSPSPQVVTQALGSPAHVQPSSSVHALEQPSPLSVLSSSQASTPTRIPSPQISSQVLFSRPLQVQPTSIWHVTSEQPSSATGLPTSHCSVAGSTNPSPQTLAVQSFLQPSLLSLSPSSQASSPAAMPSPHDAAPQTLGAVEGVSSQVQPASTTQAVQPSSAVAFPSSQASSKARSPSPQVLAQLLVAPDPPVHV